MKRLLIIAVAMFGLASAYLKSYEVTPTQASWSGWARGDPQYGVGNTFVANFDSIAEVQVFVGYVGDTSHHYDVDVYEYPNGYEPVAHSHGVPGPTSEGHVWLRFAMTPDAGGKSVRGKEYLLVAPRTGRNAELDFRTAQVTMCERL